MTDNLEFFAWVDRCSLTFSDTLREIGVSSRDILTLELTLRPFKDRSIKRSVVQIYQEYRTAEKYKKIITEYIIHMHKVWINQK